MSAIADKLALMKLLPRLAQARLVGLQLQPGDAPLIARFLKLDPRLMDIISEALTVSDKYTDGVGGLSLVDYISSPEVQKVISHVGVHGFRVEGAQPNLTLDCWSCGETNHVNEGTVLRDGKPITKE